MHLLSVDNITNLVPNDVYQIMETKGKENNLSYIKMKLLKSFIFILN
jgi:small nuclear ribonucleoprotein (snRNP)-like protein